MGGHRTNGRCASSPFCLVRPVRNLLVFDDLKRAILQRVSRSPEQHRQRFHSLGLGESGRPFVMAQQLWDSCRKWLLAEGSDVEGIIDRVVLDQFITHLPRKTAEWVQCHRPTSLNQAIQLAEDQMVACPGVGEPLPSASLPLSLSLPLPLGPSPSPGLGEDHRRNLYRGGGWGARVSRRLHPVPLPGGGGIVF